VNSEQPNSVIEDVIDETNDTEIVKEIENLVRNQKRMVQIINKLVTELAMIKNKITR